MAFKGNNISQNTLGWIGNGSILVSRLDENDAPVGGFFSIGNCSSAVLGLTTEKIEMQDMQYGTRGTVMSQTISSTGELTINSNSYSPEVLALALYGNVVIDSEQTDAVYVGAAYKGRSIVVDGIILDVDSIETEDSETLVEGVDYVVSNGSIQFTENLSITDGAEVTVSYTKAETSRIEGFVGSDVRVCIVFDGFNTANMNKPVKVTYHKVTLNPASQRQLLSAEYGEHELTGSVEVSSNVTGSGLSKMFKEEHAA